MAAPPAPSLSPELLHALYTEDRARWRVGQRRESGALRSLVAARQYRTLCRSLQGMAAPGASVLDWGCGSGVFATALAIAGFEVSAADRMLPERAMTDPGKVTFVRLEDPVLLPFDGASFQVVLSNGCLEHVGESGGSDVASLREVARVLAPGGIFLCTHLPNRGSYIERIARVLREPVKRLTGYPLYAHSRTYDPAELEPLGESAGLETVNVERYGMFPRNPLSLLPAALVDSPRIADLVDAVDDALVRIGGRYSQNLCWVARKPQ